MNLFACREKKKPLIKRGFNQEKITVKIIVFLKCVFKQKKKEENQEKENTFFKYWMY